MQYSSSDQTLYYVVQTEPLSLVKASSINGKILISYQLNHDLYTSFFDSCNHCSLSKDGLTYFWNIAQPDDYRAIIRLNTSSSQIDSVLIYNMAAVNDFNILAIYNKMKWCFVI